MFLFVRSSWLSISLASHLTCLLTCPLTRLLTFLLSCLCTVWVCVRVLRSSAAHIVRHAALAIGSTVQYHHNTCARRALRMGGGLVNLLVFDVGIICPPRGHILCLLLLLQVTSVSPAPSSCRRFPDPVWRCAWGELRPRWWAGARRRWFCLRPRPRLYETALCNV